MNRFDPQQDRSFLQQIDPALTTPFLADLFLSALRIATNRTLPRLPHQDT